MDIDVFVNDTAVGRKFAALSDYGGVHIPQVARTTLHPGENTLVVRSVDPVATLDIDAGLIDWRSPAFGTVIYGR